MAEIYTRRLSGPQGVEEVSGNAVHVTVPAGRVYVIKRLLCQATTANTLVVNLVLLVGGTTAIPVYGLNVPGNSAVSVDTLLPMVAGEILYAYRPGGTNGGFLTCTGYDFDL